MHVLIQICWQVEIEEGKTLEIRALAMSDVDSAGMREVFFEFNGQLRTVLVRDVELSKVCCNHA